MKKVFSRLGIILLILFVLFLLLYVIVFHLHPGPVSYIMRAVFSDSPAVAPPDYDKILTKINSQYDIEYPSDFKDNMMDIYIPSGENTSVKYPVVIWIHGGGFVGGDKSDARYFAQTIAAHGYAVFSINYSRAPESKYPTPFFQLSDAYLYILDHADEYSSDPSRLFLAGDSAGGQIAAQAANTLTNEEFGKKMPFQLSLPRENLKGVLLYSSLLAGDKMTDLSSNLFSKQFFQMVGWGYFGEKKWYQTHLYQESDIIENVSQDFPPTFITDGNYISFEEQARKLVSRLDTLGVANDSLFFPQDEYHLPHEYQFVQNTLPAQIAAERTVEFLDKHSSNETSETIIKQSG